MDAPWERGREGGQILVRGGLGAWIRWSFLRRWVWGRFCFGRSIASRFVGGFLSADLVSIVKWACTVRGHHRPVPESRVSAPVVAAGPSPGLMRLPSSLVVRWLLSVKRRRHSGAIRKYGGWGSGASAAVFVDGMMARLASVCWRLNQQGAYVACARVPSPHPFDLNVGEWGWQRRGGAVIS